MMLIVLALIVFTIYAIKTNRVTEEERDEMLNSEDMFP
jgi:hypothetical protein